MFFFFSKILLIILLPVCWIFFLLVYSVITKNSKRRKRCFFIALGLLYFFSMPFFLNYLANIWDITQIPPVNKKYSCAIVLGGFTSIGEHGEGHFNASADRFIETVKLKDNGAVSKILMSGGSGLLFKGQNFKEADYVLPQFKAVNIPDSTVLSENQSRNTLENAVFSKYVLDKKKIKGPYLLVTSAFHMRRSLYIFKKAGLDVVAYPCDFKIEKNSFSITQLIIPSAETLSLWNIYIKEFVGYIVYSLKPVHVK